MSWTGLVSFLFLIGLVIASLRRGGFKRSDFSWKKIADSFRKHPKLMSTMMVIAVADVSYIFARKTFPHIFPDWVGRVELGFGIILFVFVGAFLFLARKDSASEKVVLDSDMLRPKFEHEIRRADSMIEMTSRAAQPPRIEGN